ncbi:hypothetical protein C4568_03735 [Candidatus Parcubacteria bacterium]|nr:MAG: hypothetical protein C4568_03735 [Candidatus Parcubacteria bacterium]
MASIHEIVRTAEDSYLRGTTKLGEYVEWDMHDTIERVDAYLNSRHTSGPTDSLGREKPFFNIVTAATNIWYRATDLDRKDIRILPSKSDETALAFMATVLLHKWMKEARFGVFLNDWGRALARYGSAVCKFVEKDGQLVPSVIPWNRLIVDPVDFDGLPRIEKLYLTPAQLKQNKLYDQQMVDDLLSAKQSRETLDGEQKDNLSNFIELYEVHGYLPANLLEDEPDEEDDTYVQQMHVIAYVATGKGEHADFTLYKGREKKDPYMITHLIKEDGRTLSIGAVEYLFDAQWMVNHSMKNMKDTLDLASKLIFQTADPRYQGKNVLSAIETGDIFVYDDKKGPLTRIANDKPDIQAFQNFAKEWQAIGQELTATPDSLRGATPPSGTALGTVQIVTSQGLSLFEIMTENKGLHVEDMMREYILPFLKKQMDTKDEIMTILDDEQITEIDAMWVPKEAIKRYNQQIKDELLKDDPDLGVLSPYQADMFEGEVRKDLAPLGNKRFFKVSDIEEKSWKDALKDFEMTISVEVTNEQSEKQAVLTTLSALLQTIAGNPMILQDPNAKLLFNKIIQETGVISPLQLSAASAQPAPQGSPPGGTEALETLTT